MELAAMMDAGMAKRSPGRSIRRAPYITESAAKAKDLVAYNRILSTLGMADPLADLPLI